MPEDHNRFVDRARAHWLAVTRLVLVRLFPDGSKEQTVEVPAKGEAMPDEREQSGEALLAREAGIALARCLHNVLC